MNPVAHTLMLASNFDQGLAVFLIVPIGLVLMGLYSFVPASRGDWSAVVLATPSLIIGGMFTRSLVEERGNGVTPVDLIFTTPLIIGVASIALCWFVRRDLRRP